MLDDFTTLPQFESFIQQNIALKLLRSKNLPIVISFLYQEFKEQEHISISYPLLIQKLSDYLEIHHTFDENTGANSNNIATNFDEKAK